MLWSPVARYVSCEERALNASASKAKYDHPTKSATRNIKKLVNHVSFF
jgi:hypothetical protein